MRKFFWLIFVLTMAGCATGPQHRGTLPRADAIQGIVFRLAPDSPTRLEAPDRQILEMAVSRKLAASGFAVEVDDPTEGAKAASHVLEARIGRMEKKATPAGFSLSFGDSNPRALAFQKANVLPVTCTLRATDRPDESASLFMDFVAHTDPDQADSDPEKQLAIYADHIATVCFNLLEHLNTRKEQLPRAGGEETQWVPEIRIESVPKSEPPKSEPSKPAPAASVSNTPPAKDSSPARAPATEDSRHQSPPAPEPTDRKRIIIRNQGSPVILDFGYERK
ncbi:MAG: hypothetical protein JXR29_13610 [Methylothermaceae bacterium]|nr:hypothetical protein [Methylothermaceae bacterium]